MSDVSKEPGIGFSYSYQIDDKRSVVFQTFVPQDCAPAVFNTLLDKMGEAVDRQAARYSVKALKKNLAMQEKQLRRVTEDLKQVDDMALAKWQQSNKRGDYKRTNEQEVHRKNVVTTQERFKEEITDLQREIAEAEAVADDGPNVRKDS